LCCGLGDDALAETGLGPGADALDVDAFCVVAGEGAEVVGQRADQGDADEPGCGMGHRDVPPKQLSRAFGQGAAEAVSAWLGGLVRGSRSGLRV
jgi:hypothetical protein